MGVVLQHPFSFAIIIVDKGDDVLARFIEEWQCGGVDGRGYHHYVSNKGNGKKVLYDGHKVKRSVPLKRTHTKRGKARLSSKVFYNKDLQRLVAEVFMSREFEGIKEPTVVQIKKNDDYSVRNLKIIEKRDVVRSGSNFKDSYYYIVKERRSGRLSMHRNQEELAKLIGIGSTSIGNFLNGRDIPYISERFDIQKVQYDGPYKEMKFTDEE